MTLLMMAILAVLTLQGLVLLVNRLYWSSRALDRKPTPTERLPLHVLIPARNERDNLPRLIESLANQTCPADSILICDDGSDDGTTEWLETNAQRNGFQWFRSAPRPEGWIGKNWACHQLGERASEAEGWLLFLDADITLHPEFLQVLRAHIASTPAILMTAIPRLIPATIWDGLLLLMVPFSVFTTLPLYFAENGRWRVYGFANGQVIAMPNRIYQAGKPHQAIRGEILEDVALAKWVKQRHGKARIWDARSFMEARMYPDLPSAEAGFAKNAVAICGGVGKASVIGLLLTLIYLIPPILVWFGNTEPLRLGALTAIAAAIALCSVSGRMAGLPWHYGLLYPLSVVLGLRVLARSIQWNRQGKIEWKGRSYSAR